MPQCQNFKRFGTALLFSESFVLVPNVMFDVYYFFPPKEEVKAPDGLSVQERMECGKLWLEQSKLMWSRLQFVYFLHVSVLGGWYVLQINPATRDVKWLQYGVLMVGAILSVLFMQIMRRDAAYMDEFKRLSGGVIPGLKASLPGRACAFLIILILALAELLLAVNVWFKFIPNL